MKRVFLFVLDSCGCGEAPDAHAFGDYNVNTLRSCATSDKLHVPNMVSYGLGNIDTVDYLGKAEHQKGACARLQEASMGKDTTIGHWEIAGVVSPNPLPTYPNGFPEEVLKPFREATGRGVLANAPWSGTEVIAKYGDTFHPKKENWEPIKGDIEFDDVSFQYPDGEEEVLSHFSLKIPAGTTVAIVGETGAGKSTLVNLACRFFEPTAGRILIDGRDYRERSQLWLHSRLGYVLQNPHLFSGTVMDNIRYGRLDATDEEVRAAAKAVSADTVVEHLEDGYNSDVGEGGDKLSTGEKQLISFARAVLADPAIFVLDEATSSIDTQTEQLIQSATLRLLKGRTSFLIAHRLSTIRQADLILVVKDGKIVEQGKHEELLQKGGYYHDLYSKQFQQEEMHSRLSGESA